MGISTRSPSRPRRLGPALFLAAVAGAGLSCSPGRSPGPTQAARSAATARGTSGDTKPLPAGPQVWAIAIGIDQYNDEAIPPCHGATRDARAVAHWLTRTAGWSPKNVLILDDQGKPRPGPASEVSDGLLPTRANLAWAFKEWLGARARPDDVVVVFFAGQAVAVPSSADDATERPVRSYLLPIDARHQQWEKTGWELDASLDPIASKGQNPIVCWLDTSVAGRGRRVDRGTAPAPSATPMLQALARWPGVTAWLAADGQPAAEPAAVGALSPFTAALVDALGSSERPRDLHACLGVLNRNPAVVAQGFRVLGGIDPALNLWSARVQRAGREGRELLLQRGHAGGIAALTFSADGGTMFTGGQDSTVKFWGVADRLVRRVLTYHMVGVTSVSLSPSGRWLASGDGSGWLRVWDLAQQREVPASPPHESGVVAVAFLADGDRYVALDSDGKSWLATAGEPQVRPLSRKSTGLAVAPKAGRVAFALAENDGKVQLHGPDGRLLVALDAPEGHISGARLATDGRLVVAGTDRGQLVIWDGQSAEVLRRQTVEGPIDFLCLASNGRLAVASGRAIRLLDTKNPGVFEVFAMPSTVNQVAFSDDARWMAVCTATGSLHLWHLTEGQAPKMVAPEDAEASGRATVVAFSPGGRRLVAGDQDGGLRTWDLPDGNQRPRIAPRRGQVAALSVSGDGRYLLQVSQDRKAQVWDLQDGRGLARLDGRWTSGALAPDGARAYLTSQDEGTVVVVDRASGLRGALTFPRPEGTEQQFGRVAVSRDGRWVAAGSLDGPLACVWDATTGKLAHTLRGHLDPHAVTAVAFSDDSKQVLTASEDGSALLWNLADMAKPAATFAMVDPKTGDPVPVAAAALSPTAPRKVVTGGIDGQILLWEEGKDAPTDLGSLERSVLAATFTPDGRWLAVAGADKSVWVWATDRPRQRLRLDPVPQHAEQVNALIAWPDSRLIASGSDDTTVRLWSLAEKSLLGTLSAEQDTPDWVAYTPDGLFDSSIDGEKQVTWLDHRDLLTLEQVYESSHVYKLTDQLRRGVRPKPPSPPRQPPPRLSIDPPARPVLDTRDLEMTITLGEPKLANLRLYQNGMPIQDAADLLPEGDRRITARVRLRRGLNQFHAMAGRPGSIDIEGRSPTVEIRFDGPDSAPELHVLAVGVSEYDDPKRTLQFADRDAQQLADFLQRTGTRAAGKAGLRLVLTNRDVTEARVDEAFITIRDRVRGRPEDTVVVFLAGHADALNERFYLLLPSFPFPKDAPVGRPPLRALAPAGIDPASVLPYVALYRNLARLNALQRLVVIDACQAEAIADDPGVQMVQRAIDGGAQRARTSYLMAARRGEPAGETSALAHGLMTYALLKGLGDRNLKAVPGLAMLEDLPNADRDRDGIITTDELRWYTGLAIPELASRFPLLVQRAGVNGLMQPVSPDANLRQSPRLQASEMSFPLIAVPSELASRSLPKSRP